MDSEDRVPTASETSSVPLHDEPPPRYSTIGPAWSLAPQGERPPGHNGALTTINVTTNSHSARIPVAVPAAATAAGATEQPPVGGVAHAGGVCPGWWSWVPGPAQFFPPGLEHLTSLNQITVRKKGRTYRILKEGDQQIYIVRRKKDGYGGINIKILNNANLEVLILNRTSEAGRCFSTSTHLEVMFPPGNMIGVVQGSKKEFSVHNPSGDLIFLIECEPTGCCRKVDYQVVTTDRFTVGRMTRQKSSSYLRRKEMLIAFPAEMELRSKALILAGAVSIRDTDW